MKILLLIISLYTFSFAKIYYAKVEPYELREISSSVSGVVVYANEDNIGKKLSSTPYLKIDSEVDEKELKLTQTKLKYLAAMLKNSENVLVNLNKLLEKKRVNYKKIESLKIKSVVEKDKEFYDLINSENQYLNTQKELDNLRVQMNDLELKVVKLKRSIKDKNLVAKNFVLYSLAVKPGQVVNISTPLAKVADISKAKLILFLDSEDLATIQSKIVYLDGKKTAYKLSRVLSIADVKNISKYSAQIIIDSPKLFSKLIQVELKDE